ncbi:MAG: hypothetical protein AAF902_14810 [Chloroflexota bacterium]
MAKSPIHPIHVWSFMNIADDLKIAARNDALRAWEKIQRTLFLLPWREGGPQGTDEGYGDQKTVF